MDFQNSKKIIIIGACLAVAAGAAVIHYREQESPAAGYAVAAPAAYATGTPGQVDPNRYPSSFSQPGFSQPGFSQTGYADAQTGYNASTVQSTEVQDGYYSSSRRPVYVHRREYAAPAPERRETDYQETRSYNGRTVYRHGRSKTHSVEIVAGTAGVGAAIGAIAGGGKGAALGALSGGAAGFAYDRLTHNHP